MKIPANRALGTPARRLDTLDTLEAITNAVIGLLVSWAATYTILPLWGLHPSASVSAGVTLMFFVLSFIRARVLRAVFRRLA